MADALRRAIIVISSHVVRGGVGNRSSVFALETLGFPVWAVPTVALAWHPGHGPSMRIVPEDDRFAALLADLERAPWLGEVGAIMSGYLGSAGQASAVASLVGAVRASNPEALYLCDPVIGDRGGLYVSEALASAIRDRLLPIADIATPNMFELGWLTGAGGKDAEALVQAARRLGPKRVVVTSAPAGDPELIGNLLVDADGSVLAEHARLDRAPHGSGDLFSALLLAGLLERKSDAEALRRASAAVGSVLERAVSRGSDEMMLASDAPLLRHPDAQVSLRDGNRAGLVAPS